MNRNSLVSYLPLQQVCIFIDHTLNYPLGIWEKGLRCGNKQAKNHDLGFGQSMAPHSSTLAWKIPWTQEPGRLQSMGSLRVGHNWATSLSLFTFMHWRRKWQPTPVFLPWESRGRRSLVGCCLWGRRVGHDWSDLAEAAAAGLLWRLTWSASEP